MKFFNAHLWFLVLIVMCIPVVYFLGYKLRNRRKRLFGSSVAMDRLVPHYDSIRRFWHVGLMMMSLLLLTVAALRPLYGLVFDRMERKSQQILIGLDVSLSMSAQDILPSRFSKAKQEILQLMDLLRGDTVGLLTFSGEAIVQCPLTMDMAAFKMFLDDASVGMIRRPGTNLERLIEESLARFQTKKSSKMFLIVLSDGEAFEGDSLKAAKRAAKKGLIIYTIAVGTQTGEPLPLMTSDGQMQGYKKDKQDQIVLSKVNSDMLREVADITGGTFYSSNGVDLVMRNVYDDISRFDQKAVATQSFSRYKEQYQIPLGFALFLFVLSNLIPVSKRLSHEWKGRI